MNIPNDKVMLLSFVNTKLRDEYPSLTEFCKSFDVSCEEITSKLQEIGYTYDDNLNKFI